MMRLLLNGLSASVAFASISQDWTNTALSPEERAAALLAEMTLQEKYDMLHGWPNELDGDVIYVGFVIGNERLGIPELRLNDGYYYFKLSILLIFDGVNSGITDHKDIAIIYIHSRPLLGHLL